MFIFLEEKTNVYGEVMLVSVSIIHYSKFDQVLWIYAVK